MFVSDFNYAVWTPNTVITLCNVPWDAQYRDVVEWENGQSCDKFIDSQASNTKTVLENVTYLRANEPVRIPIPFNDAYRYNYLRVHNPAQPVGESAGRTFYYFIQDIRHLAPNTTELALQLDVWQSFRKTVNFGRGYVERGHVGIADATMNSDGAGSWLTEPEGIDLGNEYQTTGIVSKPFAEKNSYGVMITSTTSLSDDPGTANDPKLRTASGGGYSGVPSGADTYYLESILDFTSLMNDLKATPWVSQGIISATAVPSAMIDTKGFDKVARFTGYNVWKTDRYHEPKPLTLTFDLKETVDEYFFAQRYPTLKKLNVYPYKVLELTSYTGTPLLLKPEMFPNDSVLNVDILGHFIQPSPRIAMIPRGYGSDSSADNNRFASQFGEFLDYASFITDLPSFSIVNDNYISYMAANRNSIAYQYSSADWSQNRAMNANNLAYDQANAGIDLNSRINQLNNRQDIVDWGISGVQGISGGITSGGARGLSTGGLPGAAAGAVTGLADGVNSAVFNGMHTANSVIHNNRRKDARNDYAGYMRDTNKAYADYAAKGDYHNQISAINAKVQDAKLIQPNTSGQVGGDAFLMATIGLNVVLKTKRPFMGRLEAIADYWYRYGYSINRFIGQLPSNLVVCRDFSYWRMKEVYLSSSLCPENYRQTFRGIMEKGVTVWRKPDLIGTSDISQNTPIMAQYFG